MTSKNLTPEQIIKVLLSGDEEINLVDELIATGEAAFSLIRHSEMELDLKCAFHQLEKQYVFYTRLVQGDEE
jgi:hypothetical protein